MSNTLLRTALVGTAALALVANMAAAQVTQKNRPPLLEFRGVSRSFNLGPSTTTTYTSSILTVYRDGWSFYNFVGSDLPTTTPFNATVVEGSMPSAFKVLNQALGQNRVGIQSGNCDIGKLGDYEYELTWYSRVSRLNSFKVGSAFRPTPCPDEVKNLFSALGDYIQALTGSR